MERSYWPHKRSLIFLLLLSFRAFPDGANFYVDRTPKPICTHEEDSSVGAVETVSVNLPGVKYRAAGRTGAELAGDELECLKKKKLVDGEGYLKPENYTTGADLNHYFNKCNFVQLPDFPEIKAITEYLHLQNRDHLLNGLWQDLANRSQRQLACRIDTIDLNQKNPQLRDQLNQRAAAKFDSGADDSVMNNIRALILSKRLINSRNQQDVFTRIDCRGFAWFFCNEVVKEKDKIAISEHESKLAAELAKVPYGYEPDVADALVAMAETGVFDEAKYQAALAKARNRYYYLNKYYTDRRPTGEGLYCIDREFKEKAAQSGVAQQLIKSFPDSLMSPTQRAVLECKVTGKYKTTEENIDAGANAVFLVGGVGAALLTALHTGGGSVAAFGAAASAGLSITSFAYSVSKANQECNRHDFLVSPEGAEICNPEENFKNEMSERKLSSCGMAIGMAALDAAFVGLDVMSVVRARRGFQIRDLRDEAAIVEEAAEIEAKGAKAVPRKQAQASIPGQAPAKEIVSTASAKKADFYLSKKRYDAVKEELRLAGINRGQPLTLDQVRQLTPEQRIFLLEDMGNTAFSKSQAKEILDIFKDAKGQPLNAIQEERLLTTLSEALKDSSKVEEAMASFMSTRLVQLSARDATKAELGQLRATYAIELKGINEDVTPVLQKIHEAQRLGHSPDEIRKVINEAKLKDRCGS